MPSAACEQIQYLASAIVQEFDRFRAPLSEAEIERSDPDGLSAAQFANLHRWGNPYVMDEFRFHMPVTGPVNALDMPRIESAHPSPLSARSGFFGSRPFSRTNDLLAQQGPPPTDWRLT